MRFAVDAHAIGRHLTGNEVYVRSLLEAFAAIDQDSEFVAYVSASGAEHQIPARFRVRTVASNPYARLGWDLARLVRQDKPDLVHVQYTAPLLTAVPVVTTVHDVSFLEHPEFFTVSRRTQLRLTVARTVRSAAKILTVSEFSRDSILRAYDIPPDKVRVVPNAASPVFRPIGREKAKKAVAGTLGFEQPFVLCVGDMVPRKNQTGLIEAFSRLVRNNPQFPHHLVLTGNLNWNTPRVKEAAAASGIASRIHFTGFVPDGDLLNLYNACECFVFPSLYEGFGMPILEAMACGKAVLCSNTSAMPEVADGAGLLFNPHAPADMERAMRDVLIDAELRGRMERLGLQRASLFSWQKSARATLDAYREAVAAPIQLHTKVRTAVPVHDRKQ